MTQKEKDLVLKELCTRLPYRVICKRYENAYELVDIDIRVGLVYLLRGEQYVPYSISAGDEIKPYLRPMSSMTEEEEQEYHSLCAMQFDELADADTTIFYFDTIESFDWLNKKMFDYRGLISKGLANSTEEFNPYNEDYDSRQF